MSIFSVAGSLAQEQEFNLRELLPEECGLAAAIHIPQASRYVHDCLMLQEHRGEDSVGIISLNGDVFHTRRRVGRVREQFFDFDFNTGLPGSIAVGHNRYATQGAADSLTNIQPLFFQDTRFGPIAIAHNGTLDFHNKIRERLTQEGVIFQSAMDSEVLGHLIARSPYDSLEEALIHVTELIPAAYSLLVFSRDKVLALRDRYGVRPLSLARIEGGFLVCSENYTFDQYPNSENLGDVKPGEMLVFSTQEPTYKRIQYAQPDEHFCIFEGIYFSDPRSRYNEYWHEDFRFALGQQIFREHPDLTGDCVIPVLDSGRQAALGLAEESGIPYREHFKRLHNPPRASLRSFTAATEKERIRTAFQKLHLRRELVRDKHVIVVDDSIVRSTTIRLINQRLREAGAKTIVNCISAPPIVDVCPYGMDFQDRNQLIASDRTVEEIRERVGADRLIYLSLNGLEQIVERSYRCGICSGCFGGRYPSLSQRERKSCEPDGPSMGQTDG